MIDILQGINSAPRLQRTQAQRHPRTLTSFEDLLTKATKMFHPSHYVPTLARIKLNTAYLRLGARNEGQAETELLMRRKEIIDEVHQVHFNSKSYPHDPILF